MQTRKVLYTLGGLGFVLSIAIFPFGASHSQNSATEGDYRRAVTYLEQGWSPNTTQRWYYSSQGTVFMPYDWFRALEQAEGQEMFGSAGHMSRLGFLVDPPDPRFNPDGLPVGFAKRELALDKGPYACWKGD